MGGLVGWMLPSALEAHPPGGQGLLTNLPHIFQEPEVPVPEGEEEEVPAGGRPSSVGIEAETGTRPLEEEEPGEQQDQQGEEEGEEGEGAEQGEDELGELVEGGEPSPPPRPIIVLF